MPMTVQLNLDPTTLVPGQVVEGTAGWDLDDAPDQAVLRLFWYTEGRGTTDVGVVEDLQLPAGKTSCRGSFRFTIPELPFSFSGQLVSVKWAIELLLNGGKMAERLDLVVSPWVEQVKLSKVS